MILGIIKGGIRTIERGLHIEIITLAGTGNADADTDIDGKAR